MNFGFGDKATLLMTRVASDDTPNANRTALRSVNDVAKKGPRGVLGNRRLFLTCPSPIVIIVERGRTHTRLHQNISLKRDIGDADVR